MLDFMTYQEKANLIESLSSARDIPAVRSKIIAITKSIGEARKETLQAPVPEVLPLPFEPFPKIPRLARNCMITEKIDGTNACVSITPYVTGDSEDLNVLAVTGSGLALRAGSRNRWLTPQRDNYGFASWVIKNVAGLFTLGEGTHYGEWWGSGIGRGYGMVASDRFFSLFNAGRWGVGEGREAPPACCQVVPILYYGEFKTFQVDAQILRLRKEGSLLVPGYTRPEGVVIYHEASRSYFKKTLEGDTAKTQQLQAVA